MRPWRIRASIISSALSLSARQLSPIDSLSVPPPYCSVLTQRVFELGVPPAQSVVLSDVLHSHDSRMCECSAFWRPSSISPSPDLLLATTSMFSVSVSSFSFCISIFNESLPYEVLWVTPQLYLFSGPLRKYWPYPTLCPLHFIGTFLIPHAVFDAIDLCSCCLSGVNGKGGTKDGKHGLVELEGLKFGKRCVLVCSAPCLAHSRPSIIWSLLSAAIVYCWGLRG